MQHDKHDLAVANMFLSVAALSAHLIVGLGFAALAICFG